MDLKALRRELLSWLEQGILIDCGSPHQKQSWPAHRLTYHLSCCPWRSRVMDARVISRFRPEFVLNHLPFRRLVNDERVASAGVLLNQWRSAECPGSSMISSHRWYIS
jgi:hypothetical protein